jgi:putative ABC transport system permease protein
VSQRTSEIGLRLALGATPRRIAGRIVGETLGVVALGAGAALAVAVAIDLHLVRGGARDLPALVAVPAVLLAVAVAASWVPASRAGNVDPVRALRAQ